MKPSLFLVLACLGAAAWNVSAADLGGPVPEIKFDSVTDFFKFPNDLYLGEASGVAVNSKKHVFIFSRGNTTGPAYGATAAEILEFDQNGKFVREIGRGVYGLAYAHSVRFDKYDNLWVVDKAAMSVIKFNPAGYVLMNLGRRDEGPDQPRYRHADPPPTPVDSYFNGSTDVDRSWRRIGEIGRAHV